MDLETKIEIGLIGLCVIVTTGILQVVKSKEHKYQKNQIETNIELNTKTNEYTPKTDIPPTNSLATNSPITNSIPSRISRTINAINYAEQLNKTQAQPKY